MGELLRAQADPHVYEELARHGVADPEIAMHCGLTLFEIHGRFYEPTEYGAPAIIVPVMDGDELCDLLAFDPREPEKWFVRLGDEPLLGASALSNQLLGKPLHIFKTPLSWLQGGCDGVVLLDLNRAFVDLVTAPNGLVGEDGAHTDELRRMITETAMRRLPRFLVRQREAA